MKCKCIMVLMITLAAVLALTGSVLMAQQDEMILDSSKAFKKKGRPAVAFPHSRHMGAGLECNACHHIYQDGKNILDESQLEPGNLGISCSNCHDSESRLNLQQAFHNQCIGCHIKYRKEKKGTYPRYCGECHIRK